jgi:hypothetical protein
MPIMSHPIHATARVTQARLRSRCSGFLRAGRSDIEVEYENGIS